MNMTIKLTKKQKIKVLNGKDVYTIMQEILLRESKIDRDKEHLWVIANPVTTYITLRPYSI
jgi:DNA repair protein RadC